MATISWTTSNGDWDTAANWGGTLPGPTDTAVINTSAVATITHSSGVADTVTSLTVGSNDTLSVTGGSITVSSGGSIAGTLVLGGGAFVENGGMTIASFTQSGGNISGTGTITVTGSTFFGPTGGNFGEIGSGSTVLLGTTQLGAVGSSAPAFSLDGSRVLINSGTFNWLNGNINLGNNPVAANAGNATIINAVGGVFNIATAGNITSNTVTSGGSNVFTNLGTLTTSGLSASGTTNIGVTFNNSGTVSAVTGALNLTSGGTEGGLFVINSGAKVQLNGATNNVSLTLSSATVTGGGTLVVGGGTVILATNETIASNFLQSGGIVNGGPGSTLTLNGASFGPNGGSFLQTGSGTTVLLGTTQLGAVGSSAPGFGLDGGHVLVNSGTFNWLNGNINLGFNPFAANVGNATITNAAGGVFDIATPNNITNNAVTSGGSNVFNNLGALTTSGLVSSGTASINVTFNNSGTVSGVTGTLNLTSGGIEGGSFVINSGANVQLNGGGNTVSFTLSSATVSGGGTFVVSGGTVLLATNETISGNFLQGGGIVSGGPGSTLTLNGASFGPNGGSFLQTGSGTTVLSGTTTLGAAAFSPGFGLDGGHVLVNSGTFNWLNGNINLGFNPFAANAGNATLVNAGGGIFNIATPGDVTNNTVTSGGSNAFINSGTVSLSGFTGTAGFNVMVTNSAGGIFNVDTAAATAGANLVFNNTVLNGGTLLIGNSTLGSGGVTVSATSVTNTITGTIVLQGNTTSSANQALFVINGANEFGTAGVVTGDIEVHGAAQVQLGTPTPIATIANGGQLLLDGPNAFVNFTGGSGNNAIGTLAANSGGSLLLENGAALTISGGFINLPGNSGGPTGNRIGLDDLGAGGSGGSTLTIGGGLTNSGNIFIGNAALSANTTLSAGSFLNTGSLNILGNTSNTFQGAVVVNAVAPATWTGSVNLNFDSLLQFTSLSITGIGLGGSIVLNGGQARIADAGATKSNSALTSLGSNAGTFRLANGAAVATNPGVAFTNSAGATLAVDDGASGLLAGGSTLSIGGALNNAGSVVFGKSTLVSATKLTVSGLNNSGGITITGAATASGPLATFAITGAGVNTSSIVLSGNALLSAGGGLTVSSGGLIQVGSGATLFPVTVGSGGSVVVSLGGVGSGTIIQAGGSETVFGLDLGATVNGGTETVSSGGVASATTISAGMLTVLAGGKEVGATLFGGTETVFGNDTGAQLRGGTLNIGSGGFISGSVLSSGNILVGASGSLAGATVLTSGSLVVLGNDTGLALRGGGDTVSSGGSENIPTISAGTLTVLAGGSSTQVLILPGGSSTVFGNDVGATLNVGKETVSSGGLATVTLVNSGGGLFAAGGTTRSATIASGGLEGVLAGGVASATTISGGGVLTVSSGGIALSATVLNFISSGTNNPGSLTVLAGGTASNTVINDGGIASGGVGSETVFGTDVGALIIGNGGANNQVFNQVISSGGLALSGTMSSGEISVASGATISAETMSAGILDVLGRAISVQVSGGAAVIEAGAVGSGFVVSGTSKQFAQLAIVSGGTAVGTIVGGVAEELLNSGTTSLTVVNSGGSDRVAPNAVETGATINAGGSMTVSSGGLAISTTVLNSTSSAFNFPSNMTVLSGGTASKTTINGKGGGTGSETIFGTEIGALILGNGGVQQFDQVVSSGGLALSGVMSSGGIQVAAGGTISAETMFGGTINVFGTAANINVSGGGVAIQAGAAGTNIVLSGTTSALASLDIASGGVAIGAIVSDISRLQNEGAVTSNTTVKGTLAGNGGILVIGPPTGGASGSGVDFNAIVSAGGTLQVFAGGVASSTNVKSGGLLSFGGAGGIAVTPVIGGGGAERVALSGSTVSTQISGGLVELMSGAIASGGISFTSVTGGTLQIDGTMMPTTTISALAVGDSFDLPNVAFDSAGSAGVIAGNILQISANGQNFRLQLDQSYAGFRFQTAKDTGSGTLVSEAVCFCRGTLISTESGDVTVEELAVGDRVRTLSGALKPIVWIGMGRDLVTRGNKTARPIIVRRGALADNVPARDLYLTHGHSLYLDGVLIPVENLINHHSILWDEAARVVEYYHIELEDHDVVLAEGAAAETYHDAGNRALFQNSRNTDAIEKKPRYASVLTVGEVVEAVWARLAQRAGIAGTEATTDDPDLHIAIGETRIDPVSARGGVYTFALEHLIDKVRLRSRSAVPSLVGDSRHEHRRLGVALRQLVLQAKGMMVCIDHESPLLREGGCHAPEAKHCWTDGDLELPTAFFAHLRGPVTLVVHTQAQCLRYPAGVAAHNTERHIAEPQALRLRM